MTPMLGIMASSISGSKIVTASFESIATQTLASAAASITFSSIPATYTHLQVRGISRINAAVNDSFSLLTFNGTTGSSTAYASHYLIGTGSSVIAGLLGSSVSSMHSTVAWGTGSSVSTSTFAGGIIDIADYASTSKYKTVRTFSGIDGNGAGQIDFASGVWQSTAAVNQITITSQGGNFAIGSSFALYGIKGA